MGKVKRKREKILLETQRPLQQDTSTDVADIQKCTVRGILSIDNVALQRERETERAREINAEQPTERREPTALLREAEGGREEENRGENISTTQVPCTLMQKQQWQ